MKDLLSLMAVLFAASLGLGLAVGVVVLVFKLMFHVF